MSERGSKSFAVKQRYFSVDYGDDIFCTAALYSLSVISQAKNLSGIAQ